MGLARAPPALAKTLGPWPLLGKAAAKPCFATLSEFCAFKGLPTTQNGPIWLWQGSPQSLAKTPWFCKLVELSLFCILAPAAQTNSHCSPISWNQDPLSTLTTPHQSSWRWKVWGDVALMECLGWRGAIQRQRKHHLDLPALFAEGTDFSSFSRPKKAKTTANWSQNLL